MNDVVLAFQELLVYLLLYVVGFIKEMMKRDCNFYIESTSIYDFFYMWEAKNTNLQSKYFKLHYVHLETARLDG